MNKEKTSLSELIKPIQINHFDNRSADGRVNSINNEDMVVALIKKEAELLGYTVEVPRVRHWFDIGITINNHFFPINIKITKGNTADNLSSKKGMLYALTGISDAPSAWDTFNTTLMQNVLNETESDYYFVVVFKDTKQIILSSLLSIDILTPNGNNLPFQCKWSDNLKPTKRTLSEQKKYILDIYRESWRKRAEPRTTLEALINEFGTSFYT